MGGLYKTTRDVFFRGVQYFVQKGGGNPPATAVVRRGTDTTSWQLEFHNGFGSAQASQGSGVNATFLVRADQKAGRAHNEVALHADAGMTDTRHVLRTEGGEEIATVSQPAGSRYETAPIRSRAGGREGELTINARALVRSVQRQYDGVTPGQADPYALDPNKARSAMRSFVDGQARTVQETFRSNDTVTLIEVTQAEYNRVMQRAGRYVRP